MRVFVSDAFRDQIRLIQYRPLSEKQMFGFKFTCIFRHQTRLYFVKGLSKYIDSTKTVEIREIAMIFRVALTPKPQSACSSDPISAQQLEKV